MLNKMSGLKRSSSLSSRTAFAGLPSTSEAGALRTLADWEDRMRAFYALAPHGAFTQVEGITEPFPIDRPSPIHPLEVTETEIETIIEFMAEGERTVFLSSPLLNEVEISAINR